MDPGLINIEDIPAFRKVKDVPADKVTDILRSAVAQLHESDDIEEFLRAILSDRAATPHGPAEIVDILTHRIELEGSNGLAAFVLKGRSYPTVRPRDASHQIYRLEKIDDLALAVFGATGIVLDGVKEQFSSTCKRLKIFYTFLDIDDFARLFWAYGFLCPRDGNRIKGGRCTCGYAPEHSFLNVLQQEALSQLRLAHALHQTKGLVILPPSSGKTRIAARDARAAAAQSVLYVAHTHEILDVAQSEFSASFGAASVLRLQGGQPPDATKVNLATIQYLTANLAQFRKSSFDYVVIDEFHHAAAPTYRKLVGELSYSFLLGLTATPFRADRQDIATLCDGKIIVQYELRSGVEMGILTPYHYFGCFDDIDYGDLPIGYTIKDLERKLIIKERHEAVIQKWSELADGKPTLAFCCSHEHARRVSDTFVACGIPSTTYLSTTELADRASFVARLERGHLKVLCVVDVLNEGADLPFIECLLFLRPTESKRIFLQQLGRGLRRHVGKSHCTVIDFIGNFRNAYKIVEYHGLRPDEFDQAGAGARSVGTAKALLDIPIGCKVNFEDRVLDIFANQALDPKNATRENISRILINRYLRLSDRLGRMLNRRDIDRYELLDSTFYDRVFGSWKRFLTFMHE